VGNPLKQMVDLGQINDRQISYIRTNNDGWKNYIPTDSWLALPIGNTKDIKIIKEVTDTCLGKGVNYVCTLGQECEFIHDYFDDSIVNKRIENGQSVSSPDDFEYEPMTTWHDDFEDGVWFAIYAAHDEHVDIKNVIFIDMTENGELEIIRQVIKTTDTRAAHNTGFV
jgi:hypothetical protein